MPNILVTRSSMPSFEEYCGEIEEIWGSHWLTNMGIKHKKLQNGNIDAVVKGVNNGKERK